MVNINLSGAKKTSNFMTSFTTNLQSKYNLT